MVVGAPVQPDAALRMEFGTGIVTHEEAVAPEKVVRLDLQRRIVRALGKGDAAIAKFPRYLHLAADHVELALPSQHHEQLPVIAQFLRDATGSAVGVRHLLRTPAPRRHQSHSDHLLVIEFGLQSPARLQKIRDEL